MYDLNDYVVIVSPTVEDGAWMGDVEVKIAWNGDNDLDDNDHSMMLHVTHMLAAALELAEVDENVAHRLTNIVKIRSEDEDEDQAVDIEREDGNVIRINFGKTQGSA